MLTRVSTLSDYLRFLGDNRSHMNNSRFGSKIVQQALHRLKHFDLSLASHIILPLYSQYFGRPAHDPAVIFRSFILMLRLGFTSIENWVDTLCNDLVYQYLLGSWVVPSAASHYDFINRIMKVDPHLDELYPENKNSRKVREQLKKLMLKKGEKWENYDEGDTKVLRDRYWDDATVDIDRLSLVIESIFQEVAVKPSIKMNILAPDDMVLSGDGTALHIHASSFGHKVPSPPDDQHTHRYTAPDANMGWDSDLGVMYFGYTGYNISFHSKEHAVDLPVFLTFRQASQHDALTTISATAQMLDLNPSLKPSKMCFDSASDAYAIYEFLRHRDIIPIIDWNKRHSGSSNPYAEYEHLSEKGIPICSNGVEMMRDGYDKSKMATKFRCPYAVGNIKECSLWGKCSSSSYGRVVKLYDKKNLKLFGPIPYKSEEWKQIYKNRTCTERINDRILNDYLLHSLTCRAGPKLLFFFHIAGINIHLDAWVKIGIASMDTF